MIVPHKSLLWRWGLAGRGQPLGLWLGRVYSLWVQIGLCYKLWVSAIYSSHGKANTLFHLFFFVFNSHFKKYLATWWWHLTYVMINLGALIKRATASIFTLVSPIRKLKKENGQKNWKNTKQFFKNTRCSVFLRQDLSKTLWLFPFCFSSSHRELCTTD